MVSERRTGDKRPGLSVARVVRWLTHGLICPFACLAIAVPSSAQVLAETPPEAWSRFHRTALYLQDASPSEQGAFATQALAQLAEVYMAEADLARTQAAAEQASGRAKLLSWSIAVDQYADQLMLLLEDVDEGYPVTVMLGREGTVTVSVAGRAVMLGHPRSDQQAAYEQRVLSDFCTANDCKRMTVMAAEPKPIPVSAARVNPDWTFTEHGPVCAHGGIELHFGSSQNLAIFRSTCEELLQEAATLAAEIAWQNRHGVAVDWTALRITATPRRPEHLVHLNAAGDSVLLTLPLFFGSPGLLQDIGPWLRDRWSDEGPATVQLRAASYGWE